MDHQGCPITTDQLGPTTPSTTISVLSISFSFFLTHLAGNGSKRLPITSNHHHHLRVDLASFSSSISSHHSIYNVMAISTMSVEFERWEFFLSSWQDKATFPYVGDPFRCGVCPSLFILGDFNWKILGWKLCCTLQNMLDIGYFNPRKLTGGFND